MRSFGLSMLKASAVLAWEGDVGTGAEKIVARALVHDRDRVEVGNRRLVERALHQTAVIEERRGIAPLRRARQERQAKPRFSSLGMSDVNCTHDEQQLPSAYSLSRVPGATDDGAL